jgi:hypothetical protein
MKAENSSALGFEAAATLQVRENGQTFMSTDPDIAVPNRSA